MIVPITPAEPPLEALRRAGVDIRGSCAGQGRCGGCAVHVSGGDPPVSSADCRLIGREGVSRGIRLGCMLPPGVYDITPVEAAALVVSRRPEDVIAASLLPGRAGPGIAVDIGTTTVQAAAFDGDGFPAVVYETRNLQRPWGSDVMSRVSAAADSGEARRLRAAALRSVEAVVAAAAETDPAWIAVVGNTVMHHLAAGLDAMPLGLRPYEPRAHGYRWRTLPVTCAGRAREATLVPPLAGLVGSDMRATIAVMVARSERDPWLIIDMGTNCEIALHARGRIWCTSAPAGPAFEGAGLSCGCVAGEGAVTHVREVNGGVESDVIGHTDPVGLCGSAVVDLCALLLVRGDLDETGRLRAPSGDLRAALGGLTLDQRDIREVQKAKAAVEVGVRAVLAAASLKATALRRVALAGAFGTGLALDHAMAIGLVPTLPFDRLVRAGNTALLGAGHCLDRRLSRRIGGMVTRVALQTEGFASEFIEAIRLRPWA